MKILALFFIHLFSPPVLPADHHAVRAEFQKVGLQEASVNKILLLCAAKTIHAGTSEAYIAAATLCSAKYKFTPISKYQTFNKGSEMLDAAIKKDTTNLEARYLRYAIQKNAPGFLGYNKQLKYDRLFLIRGMPGLKSEDPHLYTMIQSFLIQHDKETALLINKG